MNVAIIPARGGSKRIPRKNIKDFCGKPMISWPITIALESGIFDDVIVSTDDAEIAEVSISYGAKVPFMRPKELADDFTGTTEVVAHAVKWMQHERWPLDKVCCIYPTSVFLEKEDLQIGCKKLNGTDWQYSISVTHFEYPIFRSLKPHASGGIEMVFPEYFSTRSQDLTDSFHDAALFYWGRPDAWTEKLKLFDAHTCPVFIPNWRVQDIDTIDDYERAQKLFLLANRL